MKRNEKKEVASEASFFWFLGMSFLVLSFPILWGLNALGLWGNTVVERKVFESSYQYQSGQASKQQTLRAQLAEIESVLEDPEINSVTKRNLRAKAKGIRILLNSK